MKRCPTCNRNYTDDTLRFCLEDGTPLSQAPADEQTIALPGEPPPTLIYHAPAPPTNPANVAAPLPPPPVWTPVPVPRPKRKVWPWVLGAVLLLCVLGGGFIVLVIGLAALGSSDNSNNSRVTRTNANVSNSNANLSNTNRVVNENLANANDSGSAPKPSPANVLITKAYMAKDNGSGEPADQAETFSPSEHTVHCMIQLDPAVEGTVIKFDWIGVNAGELQGQSIKQLDYTTKARENNVHAHLTLPRDWPEGEYKVDVYVNDQLARSITYKVE